MKNLFCIALLLASLAPNLVYAQRGIRLDPSLQPQGAVTFDTGGESADNTSDYTVAGFRRNVVLKFMNIVLGTVGIVTVFFLMFNGFMLAKSGGNEEDLPKYKKGLTWALVGLLAIILSYSIIRTVITLTFTADEAAPAGQTQSPARGGRAR